MGYQVCKKDVTCGSRGIVCCPPGLPKFSASSLCCWVSFGWLVDDLRPCAVA